jgi:hypothetical protein
VATKRNKTEDDQIEMRRLEWTGGLVLDDDGHPALSAPMLLGSWRDGAKKTKEGKALVQAVLLDKTFYPIKYDGPNDVDELWQDGHFSDTRRAGQGRSGVMRTRPIFRNWSVIVTANVDPDALDMDRIIPCIDAAGTYAGIGDYRPAKSGQYGRYCAERV